MNIADAGPTASLWGSADTVFDRLEGGCWALDRRVEGQADMHGRATFQRLQGGMLHYREEGKVRLVDGKIFDAHREYRWSREARGFAVFFAESPPRLFHRIELAWQGDALVGSASHLCAPDSYDSRYRFLADGGFVVRHLVRGPRKNYVSETVFRRPPTP
jgi:hypothetical protein